MPLLDALALIALRERQKRAAVDLDYCRKCGAATWPNYCRECDEQFVDGHYAKCPEFTKHQGGNHRRY